MWLHYVDHGAGEPALLLLHGGGASVESWSAVVPALSAAARVVALDRPGWGKSARPPAGLDGARPSPYGPTGEAAIVAQLVERLGLGKPILLGSSSGGTIALLAALDHPALFSGLVLVAPGVFSGLGLGLAPKWIVPLLANRLARAIGPRLAGNGFSKAFTANMRKMFLDEARVTPDFLAARGRAIGLGDLGATLWETAIAARALGLPARLGACELPTLIVGGAADRFVPVEENERVARALPRARLEIVPDCGHLPHEEQPDAFARLVLSFRASLPR